MINWLKNLFKTVEEIIMDRLKNLNFHFISDCRKEYVYYVPELDILVIHEDWKNPIGPAKFLRNGLLYDIVFLGDL